MNFREYMGELAEKSKKAYANFMARNADYVPRTQLEETQQALQKTQGMLNAHIVDQVGLARRIEGLAGRIQEQDNLIGHQKYAMKGLRSHNHRILRRIFNEKPYERVATILVDDLGKVYFHNRRAMKLARGRFRGQNIADQIPLENLTEKRYPLKINNREYNAFPKKLEEGIYLIVLKNPGIAQKMAHRKELSPEDILHSAEVAKANVQADVSRREAKQKGLGTA